ncbi:alpha/beta hydrolase [Flavobacterium ammonificans]|jgi:pimeloyl-ACP methyl ester carboxylesterase|uniref:alpha/beta hydrolase n=1 Tax=Flavobacterium ammonificans TaxID=1751056 RepID=UPI001E5D0515|nr:alpha/beta hydrolase [Flavobacterium ammonificans]BDB56809.1 alpha/beta hydrolase [Flavobacterium ammonificans]
MRKIFISLFLIVSASSFSQVTAAFTKENITVNSLLNGSLYTPNQQNKKLNLVILIAGSGPTDRDGNQMGLVNNSLKLLAEALANNGIAVYSYDKRIFAQMASGKLDEASLSFDNFIDDAKAVIQYFKNQKKYNSITVAGHSEGALIGMVAANGNADGYISIAGAGRPIDEVLLEQIEKQAPFLKEEVQKNLETLKNGTTFELKNQMLASLFRASVQPYMISWIKYNPQTEIKKLQIPTLLINGDKDIQVSVQDAQLLQQAKLNAQLHIIQNMNHVFKEIKGDDAENKAAYTNPDLPISIELSSIITTFIRSL